MYSRIVKIIPVTQNGEDEEDLQYGILDQERKIAMSGFVTFGDAADELRYRNEEVEKIGDFGGDTIDFGGHTRV